MRSVLLLLIVVLLLLREFVSVFGIAMPLRC